MWHLTTRLAAAGTGLLALIGLAGCENPGERRNFDRGQVFASAMAGADLTDTADTSVQTGTASYSGTGFGRFTGGSSGFNALSDLALQVDFDDGTLSGDMTGWISEDSMNYTMEGDVLITNGRIAGDGTFVAQLAGNVLRKPTARNILGGQGDPVPGEDPEPRTVRSEQIFFGGGDVVGTFHDEWDTRAPAEYVQGEFAGPGLTGFFAGRRD